MFKKITTVLFTVAALFSSSLYAEVLDIAEFKRIATEVIQESMKGEAADTARMIQQNEALIEMGIEASRSYAAANPQYAKLLTLAADNADAMQKMSLEQVEEEWHEFGFLASHGIDAESIEHFGAAISLMDSIVHPATAIIAIRAYQTEKDEEHLEQVKAELSEALEHLKHVH